MDGFPIAMHGFFDSSDFYAYLFLLHGHLLTSMVTLLCSVVKGQKGNKIFTHNSLGQSSIRCKIAVFPSVLTCLVRDEFKFRDALRRLFSIPN